MTTTTYLVKGMTCDHCVRAVTDEVARVEGVTGVDVDLASGQIMVSSAGPLEDAAIRSAVDEAGYELVG